MIELEIIPFGKVDKEILEEISEELRYSLKILSEISEARELPKEAYNALRDQFLGEKVLEIIFKNFKGKILAVTNKDLYAEGLNFIFGQAQLNGRVAIVSVCRLNPSFYGQEENKGLLIKRAIKEAVHEVGHLLGLSHCDNPKCVMSFSNSITEVDRKSKELCKRCKTKLGLYT